MKKTKKQFPVKRIIAIAAAVAILASACVSVILVTQKKQGETEIPPESAQAHDEYYTKDMLQNGKIDDILGDSEWKDSIKDTTEDYVAVNADKFSFSKAVGIDTGYSYIYYDHDSRDINMLQHNYVAYLSEGETAENAVEKQLADIKTNVGALLGPISQKFMLVSLTGEVSENLSDEEMIAKTITGEYAMYCLYELDGIVYEMNIHFDNQTLYTTAWIYEQELCTDESCGHEHN